MFCPLLYQGVLTAGTDTLEDAACLQIKCAWWESNLGKCAVTVDAYLRGSHVARAEARHSEGG